MIKWDYIQKQENVIMPNVKGKKFPYTAKGKAEAAAYADSSAAMAGTTDKAKKVKLVRKKKRTSTMY